MSNEKIVSKNQDLLSDSEDAQQPLSLDSVINWQLPLLSILFVSVVFVSIKTVVNRHESRTAFMQLQKLEKERDTLAAQWSRLKLEQAVTLNQVRVEQYARWDLNMKIPKASEVKIIQESKKTNIASIEESRNIKVSTSNAKAASTSKVVLGN